MRYYKGDTNILITAPHGGGEKPKYISPRKYGKTFRDSYSKSFTFYLLNRFKEKPYYLIADIHRSKVDLNREIKEACQGNFYALKIFESWNRRLRAFKEKILQRYNNGIYLDIHSHNNSNEIQLGYNINTYNFLQLLHGRYITNSTLDSLNHSIKEMVLGKYSFKSTLERQGFKIFTPKYTEEYFNGGYSIETYSGNGLGGIQIELPVSIIKYKHNRYKLSKALYNSIMIFRKQFV